MTTKSYYTLTKLFYVRHFKINNDIPFLLKQFLNVNMIKNDVIQELRQQNSLQRDSQVITMIIQCWINFAIIAKLVFTSTLQDSDYARFDQLSKDFTNIVLKVKIV